MAVGTSVLLVEGDSDRNAILTVAGRIGRDLSVDGIEVISMGGAGGFGDHLAEAVSSGFSIAGLCDEGEVWDLQRGMARAGLGSNHSTEELNQLGFYVCVRDLEEEMIRAIGPERVVDVIEEEGEIRPFEKFQLQPEWRRRPLADQLRRFIGTRAGRKVRFGTVLAETVDLDRVPRPILGVLGAV